MDVIQLTRELGVAIQNDNRYIEYMKAKEANDKDTELQDLIGDFNLKRQQLSLEMNKGKDEKNPEKITELNKEMQGLYGSIMGNQQMIDFNQTKQALDTLVQQINTIIGASVNGEDPATCDTESGCGDGCSSCSGCG